MEIFGFLPFPETIITKYNELNGTNYTLKLLQDKFTVAGTSTENDNEYSCVLQLKCTVNSIVPVGDTAEDEDETTTYDKTIITSSAVIIKTNTNLDVQSISDFTLVDYTTGNSFTMSFDINEYNTPITITNYMNVDYDLTDIKTLVDDILNDLNNMQLPNLEGNIFTLSDGSLTQILEVNSLGQNISKNRWKGNYPLDVMINIITVNLDNLVEEDKLKGDSYAIYYTQLMQIAMQLAVELEKSRWALVVESYIKLLSLKAQCLNVLAQFVATEAQISSIKAQIRTQVAQFKGFNANNKQKIFTTQVEGATSAFAAGMTETAPPIYNNAELMNIYTTVKADIDDL